jgi:hypothetical protein
MGMNAEASAAEQKKTKSRFEQNIWQALNYYGHKLAGRLRGLFKRER